MSKFARLLPADGDGRRFAHDIVEVESVDVLAPRFHPTLLAQFVAVPDAAVAGSSRKGNSWHHPDPVEYQAASPPPAARRTLLTPPEYLLLYTPQERVAIRAAAATPQGALVADWLAILNDPRLAHVDVASVAAQQGHEALVASDLLTPERMSEIEQGLPV